MQIAPASAHDLPALEGLFEEVDAHHRDRIPERFRAPDGKPRTHEHLLGLVEGPDSCVLLVRAGDDALGFAIVQVRDTPPVPLFVPRRLGIVDSLGVAARARRQGIGRALMAAAEAWAREHGAQAVELTVYEANPEAIRFYETLGYHPLSRRLSRAL